jgi:hypothetical protein
MGQMVDEGFKPKNLKSLVIGVAKDEDIDARIKVNCRSSFLSAA